MRRKSNIVPGLVLGASFTAVVPACVLAACSGGDPVVNLRQYGVAAVAYCCFEGGGVAVDAFASDVRDAANEGDAPREGDAPSEASDAPSDSPEGG